MKLVYLLLAFSWIPSLRAFQAESAAPHPSPASRNRPPETVPKNSSQTRPSVHEGLKGNAKPGIAELDAMSSEQRQKSLQSLSPRQRERVEKQLKAYNSLSPDQRLKLADQYRLFRQLPSAKQNKIREAFGRLQNSTPERQQAIRGALDKLNALPLDQQREWIDSKDFKDQFSRGERRTIEELMAVPKA